MSVQSQRGGKEGGRGAGCWCLGLGKHFLWPTWGCTSGCWGFSELSKELLNSLPAGALGFPK